MPNNGHDLPRVNDGGNTQYNGYNGLNNGTFHANQGPNVRPTQVNQQVNQPIGVPYDPNVLLRNQIAEIVQDQMVVGCVLLSGRLILSHILIW